MNPVLSNADFDSPSVSSTSAMTIRRTVNKCFILFAITAVSALYTWSAYGYHQETSMLYASIGGVLGFILALVTSFKQNLAPVTSPAYALCEGLLLGGISASYNSQSHGLAVQAVLLSFGTLVGMLFLFQTNILRATPTFVKVIVGATLGVALTYLAGLLLSLLHVNILSASIFSGGTVGIAFSLVVVTIAALNLILDFEFIKQGADSGTAPKYMEWYAAFGLLVTVVWLYLEILKLRFWQN